MKGLNELTIRGAYEGLKNKEFTSVDLTKACLERIKERNKDINAFISIFEENALVEAKRADEMIEAGQQQMLTGIPFAVKDAIDTLDARSTGAAKILDNYVPPFEATVITKIRAQGAVLLGKNNCDAFGHGASNENSMYGPVANPHDLTKVSGGSSGGSAAAVADYQCIFAIAEDTGGSIRQPASFCGIVGLRPSYGRNSRYGIMPMASSLDTVGPMGKTVEDIAILMEVMAGKDDKDATTVTDAVPKYSKNLDKKEKFVIGLPQEYFNIDGMDEETRKIVEEKIEKIKSNSEFDVEFKEVSLPYTKYGIPVYYIIVPSEDSSNLGRLDGVRYGVRSSEAHDLYNIYAKSRGEGFPEEVKRRIMVGTYSLSSGYYDAYYSKAQKVRTLIIEDFNQAFAQVDLLITPTSPFTAFGIGAKKDDVMAMYLADVFVSPSAVAGLPGISIPVGKDSKNLSVGMQIIGPRLSEEKLLNFASLVENI
ncbi:MAG: Asp-tRNA(Asn)/Glu-tRNA(Gln) amidotransferase GatCAB subunit A [Candidatus Magasanikbacteria bacterium CG10_big_fil_rev_8_21_14_0_10_36_16]|uniref:Glutamyl-tRNA(Gln) amidotransferase subunit A n=1 Tax=Candidatus Magasanikbacteria bacterium CG10_big_fil_rev_8_21_14_0_10_36_16 TaxID=1974645 RepID=A0A2H0TXU4_9BACT|nr:MAG: Asp-tRNA(Asn)/Glu-tRNA(Gln) amidotransferase GatCAB subunit A [Candidatus Magasanikbacteria bacterium CG10_big_fil_rev_8_21_14_0_10_36_16]